jgi:hypothetical protein
MEKLANRREALPGLFGLVLEYGFMPEPMPRQTIEDLARTEGTFREKVIALHPGADGKCCVKRDIIRNAIEVLTRRAYSLRARMASCVVATLHADARRCAATAA